MSSIQQFANLPPDIQQEVLDFMEYLAARRGITLHGTQVAQSHWLSRVNRGKANDEKVSDTVIRLRSEERW
jgi:uncharacterized protein involved in type VI secretion and phage assembly